MLDFQAARWTIAKEVPGQAGNNHPDQHPDRRVRHRRRLHQHRRRRRRHLPPAVQGAGRRTPGQPIRCMPPDAARSQNRDALNEAIGAITRGKTSAEWIEALNKAGRAVRPDLQDERGVRRSAGEASGMTRTVPHKVLGDVEVIGQPIELSRTPWSIRSATPEAGRAYRRGAGRTWLQRGRRSQRCMQRKGRVNVTSQINRRKRRWISPARWP